MNKTTIGQQAKTSTVLPPAQSMLQRKCACGNHTVAGVECEACTKKKSALQRKLAIGASNDPLEQEADRVADQVMSASPSPVVSGAPPCIQRYTRPATEGSKTAPTSVDRVLAGSGRPLEPALRQDMEQRFGYDFSSVRVHSGETAEQSAREVNAHAYTVGRNIVFGAGMFTSGKHQGRWLIAHELTHVVQQSGAEAIRLDQRGEKQGLSPVSAVFVQRQPAPPQRRGKILSLSEIAADPKREKARKNTGQTSAKICRSISKGSTKDNCPETLPVGLEVTIVAEKAGGVWLQIIPPEQIPGFGPKEPLYIMAAFVQELPASAAAPAKQVDIEPDKEEPTTAQEDKQRKVEADRIKAAEKEVADALVKARAGLQQANSLMSDVDQIDLDLLDTVRAQGEGVVETIELLDELGPLIAGLSEAQRNAILGFAYLEAQMYAQNAQHLYVLNKNVKLDLPDEATNAEEVEEELDRFAEWHEDWIVQNSYVGDLAADFFALATGLEEKIDVNLVAAEKLIEYQKNLKEEGEALQKINGEMDNLATQIKNISNKSTAMKALDIASVILTRGRAKRPPKMKPPKAPKAPKGGGAKDSPKNKPTKTRKQFKKPKDQTKPKKAKERKKKDKKRKQRKGAYPICWPTLLGPPMLAGVPVPGFVRKPGAERDESAAQQLRMEGIRNKGPVARDMHLHHSVPLFLGGLDATPMNLTLIPKKNHLTGHSWLAHQPQMAKPAGGLKPMPVNLYDHPAGTLYRFKGFKASRTETC